MPTPQYPTINGIRYDWSSVEVKLGAIIFNGVKSISYKHSLEPGELRGNRAQLIGRTRGKYSAEGSIELYRLEYDALISQLNLVGQAQGLGYMEVSFDIDVAFNEASLGITTTTDVIKGCRIKSADRSMQEGEDPTTVKLDLHIMYILENTLAPMGARQFLK